MKNKIFKSFLILVFIFSLFSLNAENYITVEELKEIDNYIILEEHYDYIEIDINGVLYILPKY